MKWKNIAINKNQIKAETGKAVLIAMPHRSEYDGYSFWHPSKLIRQGRHSAEVSMGYTDDFTFRLKKYGKGKYNSREVIDELNLAADEIEAIYADLTECDEPQEYEPLIYTPDPLEPECAKALEELTDNE